MCKRRYSLDGHRNQAKDAEALRRVSEGDAEAWRQREAEIQAMAPGPHKAWAMWDEHDGD